MTDTRHIRDTLYVTDLDGTLLDDCGRVSPRAIRILNALIDRGVMFTCATARTPATVQPLLRALHHSIPAVVMTGASMWNLNRQRYISPQLLPAAAAEAVARICREAGINPFIYVLDEREAHLTVYHNGACTRGEQRFIDERRHLPLKRFCLDSKLGLEPYIPGTILIFAMGPKDVVFEAAERVRATVDCSVSAYVDIFGEDTGILEVYHPGVSKAATIQALASKLGVKRIVAFGDNLNDIPMMRIADEAYAVANALPEVKAVATEVIGSNLTDAVPRKIASLCGLHPELII